MSWGRNQYKVTLCLHGGLQWLSRQEGKHRNAEKSFLRTAASPAFRSCVEDETFLSGSDCIASQLSQPQLPFLAVSQAGCFRKPCLCVRMGSFSSTSSTVPFLSKHQGDQTWCSALPSLRCPVRLKPWQTAEQEQGERAFPNVQEQLGLMVLFHTQLLKTPKVSYFCSRNGRCLELILCQTARS